MSNQSINIPYNFIPRNYQLELFRALDGQQGKPETRKRRAILRWHRRAGKDKCCWCYLLKEAAQVTGNYFYIFPTKTMSRQALWENIDKDGFKLLNHLPKEFITRLSNQEMLIELVNKSTIRVLGYDKDPDSIRGVACKGAVFSEVAFSDPESYKTMMPALRESKGWAIFNSTPNGRNHFYDLWQNAYNSENWFASLLQTCWPNKPGYSGILSPEEIASIQNEEGLTQDEIEREFGVSFSSGTQGAYYMNSIESAYNSGRISDFVYDDTLKVDTFWDLGIDDSTAVWFRQRKGNKLIFIDYYEESGKDLQHFVRMLESKGYNYETHYLPHDAGHRSIQTGGSTADLLEDLLRATDISDDIVLLNKLPVQSGINAVRARFSRYCFDINKCAEGLKKLELYHKRWDKRRSVFLKEPMHDSNSHAADALRMEAISEDLRNDEFYTINNIKVEMNYDIFA